MSNVERIENVKQVVKLAESDFNKLAQIHNAVNYQAEASFALQILKNNDYLMGIAIANQDSLRTAIINVAAIGLSLNPVHKLAYLVPRDGKVCLDISYRGYVQLGIECGVISRCAAEIVRIGDSYTYHGMDAVPTHAFDPFKKDRGEIVGAYCVAKSPSGEVFVTQMPIEEIYAIRNRGSAWKAYVEKKKTCSWVTDESEMIKKTVIKRAWKSWPTAVNDQERIERAIDSTNDINFEVETAAPLLDTPPSKRESSLAHIRAALAEIGRTEEKFLEYLPTICRRKIDKLEDMTEIEMNQAQVLLNQLAESARAKKNAETPKEGSNENAS